MHTYSPIIAEYLYIMTIDQLDARLIALLAAEPRLGVLECSRRLGVARGTVQARLDRLTSRGWSPGSAPTSTRRRSATT